MTCFVDSGSDLELKLSWAATIPNLQTFYNLKGYGATHTHKLSITEMCGLIQGLMRLAGYRFDKM